jgi:proteasome lid subunit RPN8/RPN11
VKTRIVDAALASKNEVIGLLLGRLQGDTIIIEDTITGEYAAEATRVVLPGESLAKIADALVRGQVKGNVVGWYHSHTESGVFFSGTDADTQMKLQQFSRLIVGMVVDAKTGEVGCYRVNMQTGEPIRIPEDRLRVYEEPSEAISSDAIQTHEHPPLPPTPVVEVRRASAPSAVQLKLPSRNTVLAVVVIMIAASAIFTGVLLYRRAGTPKLSITHEPILNAVIGTPIDVTANVTEAQQVRLVYNVADGSTWTTVNMSAEAPGQYAYAIPGSQVTGSIQYYIQASDSNGNSIQSDTYQVQVEDFRLITSNGTLTVYRTQAVTSQLTVLPINGFSESVILNATTRPQGVRVGFSENPVPAGTSSVIMNVFASSAAANGTFLLGVTASFSPPNATPVLRQSFVTVTIADFALLASPASSLITRGQAATFLLNLIIAPGFKDKVNLSVQGLPSGATATFSTAGNTLEIGPGTTIIKLDIVTAINVKAGVYSLTVIASGGGIVHYQIVQLTVR